MESTSRNRHVVLLALTLVATLALSACSSKNPPATWAKVDPPVIKGETDEIVVDKGTLADGSYWATIAPVSGSSEIAFRVLKARFGDACYAWAKENGIEDGCLNDYHVDDWPDAYVALDKMADVSVATADGPGTSWSINADTLKRLVFGGSVDAPKNYTWTPFPFLVTVTNGRATTAQQYWVP